MAIEKLTEFAKTGQKDTDQLDLETGFIVNRKPARQWFNWLFNVLTLKINELIDADYVQKSNIIDNLTTDDATKPVSAAQAKKLQDEKVNKSDVIALNKGGTGATTAANARENLGLGTAATMDYGMERGRLTQSNGVEYNDFNRLANNSGGFAYMTGEASINAPTVDEYMKYSAILQARRYEDVYGICISLTPQNSVRAALYCLKRQGSTSSYTLNQAKIYTSNNTMVDSNGFIKRASPVLELYADHIELNNEAKLQDILFEKLGIGDYLIKNSSGLAKNGWYVEQPKDANGNVYHAVVYEQLENGDISVKTFEQKLDGTRIIADLEKPVDIKESRFISVRLNELPSDPTAPENPNIVDSEGNPAPSKYHVLENGIWIISGEDALKLAHDNRSLLPKISKRQFALYLFDRDMYDQVMQAIEANPRFKIEYDTVSDIERLSPTVAEMSKLLNWTDEQVDAMWQEALTL